MEDNLINRDATQRVLVDTSKELKTDVSTVREIHEFQGNFLSKAIEMGITVRLPSLGLFRFSRKKYEKYKELNGIKDRK